MRVRLISRFLLRAPLLPVAALADPALARREPLFAEGVAQASPDLAAHGRGPAKARTLSRYLRRAAFRTTPHGLFAGVCVGELAARTRIDTAGARVARSRPTWAAVAAQARQLLDDPTVRPRVRLRRAPSLLWRHDRAQWLAFGGEPGGPPQAEVREAEVDEALAAVLDATADWTPWRDLGADDDYLLLLVDDRLLLSELEPPLVGPPPHEWLAARLDDLRTASPLFADLAQHTVLVHEPRRPPTLARAAVERAAGLAPLLFRLQEALAPPAAERDLDRGLAEALDATTESFGAGALDLAALALGDYGVPLTGDDDAAPAVARAVAPPLLALLVERMALGGGGAKEWVIAFGADELDAVLPAGAPPPSFELFLAPAREPRGALAGTGWLLGLHAPAGATWGRFAHATTTLMEPLGELATAERATRPGEETLDVAYAPSAATADLAAHPPVRGRTLALASWPAGTAGAAGAAGAAVLPAELALVVDGAAAEPLALRVGMQPVAPSPLARLRSTTAEGIHRLLVGARLTRQHAPWALHLGPLAGLARLPRVIVDGFVVAPASWRLPDDVAAGDRRALGRWRRAAGVPRHLQIGHEDELLLVDLDARDAADELARLCGGSDSGSGSGSGGGGAGDRTRPRHDRPRAFEIWPPLGASCDAGGRRVEAVVAAVVDDPAAPAAIAATAGAGLVPPPLPAPGWRTWKCYGVADRADRVLAGALGPAVHAALAAREIDAWFFLRYVDPPGRREHLRLRAHGAELTRFERRLATALAPARAAGDVVTIETAEYFPERARFAGAPVERIFQSDSELVLQLLDALADHEELDATMLVVRSLDSLAAGLGLSLTERAALAARRRAAHEPLLAPDRDALAAEHRARGRSLVATLTGHARDAATPAFAAHTTRLRTLAALAGPARDAILPALLHLAAVRLVGPDRHAEARALYHWQRALESAVARR